MIRDRGNRGPTRDEEGATTVMVALLALVLFGAGALAVDIGQVYAKRSALQSNVDHAVMAAAAELTQENGCNAEVINTATEYLQKAANEAPDQAAVNLGGSAGDDDGFIQCSDWRVSLWAPTSHVTYGMARAVTDTEGVDVPAFAAAQIKSPATSRALPIYSVAGCDNGSQQLLDPPNGHNDAAEPPELQPDSGSHSKASFSIDPTEVDSGTSGTVQMTLSGNQLDGTAQVAFTNQDGDHHTVAPSAVSKKEVQISSVPQEVLDADGVWWVRVFDGSEWSDPDDAQPFTVGDLLFCNGSVSGNFGTLKIARSDVNGSNAWVEMNIIKGPEPLLAKYDGPAVNECDDSAPWITSEKNPVDGTNCVGTDPGFAGQAATSGLVTGSGGEDGRLNADTTEGCGNDRTIDAPKLGKGLNDDRLACFIIGGNTVADVISGDQGVLSSEIFESPRFFQVPVIPVEASNGSSNFYPIIDFRPGFITMEGSGSPLGAYNGVEFHSNKVQKLNVVLFPESALPETAPPVGGEVDYIGSGIKVVVLVE